MDFRDDKCIYIGFYPLLGKAIDALVEYRVKLESAQEANKARIEELNAVAIAHPTLSDPVKAIKDRIKELTEDRSK